MVIDSPGGLVEESLILYDHIRILVTPVTGIVVGQCSSMALIILQACSRRLATEHSYFYCHMVGTIPKVSFGSDNWGDQCKYLTENLEDLETFLVDIISQRTGKTPEEVKQLFAIGERYRNVKYYSGKAKELKLIDEIVPPEDNIWHIIGQNAGS